MCDIGTRLYPCLSIQQKDNGYIYLKSMGECKKLRDLLDAMVEWSQALLMHKIEIIPSNPELVEPSPKAFNMHDNKDS